MVDFVRAKPCPIASTRAAALADQLRYSLANPWVLIALHSTRIAAGQGITVQGCLKRLKTSVCAHGFTRVKAYDRQWLRPIIDNWLSTLWNIKSLKPVIKWRIIGLLSRSKNIYVDFFKNARKMTRFTVTVKNYKGSNLIRVMGYKWVTGRN